MKARPAIVPFVKDVSEFRPIGNRFNAGIILETGGLMRTEPIGDAQQMKQCVYSIPCDCGRCYVDTSGSLEVRIKLAHV
jgi:hypothetical protein